MQTTNRGHGWGDPMSLCQVVKCICRVRPQTIQAAAELIDEYIYFYNHERIQLATKMTPIEVRLGAA